MILEGPFSQVSFSTLLGFIGDSYAAIAEFIDGLVVSLPSTIATTRELYR